MSRKIAIRDELDKLYKSGFQLAKELQGSTDHNFHHDYQTWYTTALRVVLALAPDRLPEFKSYYEIDPKRKSVWYGTYVIQDYMKNVTPVGGNFDTRVQATYCFYNQLTILNSLTTRIESVLSNIEGELYAELQDNEVAIARQLIKVSPRAAGALMGVVIEGHLQKVATRHDVKIAKKNPTIADLNDPLKTAGVLDLVAWRKVTLLADIRNLCSHKKDIEPTKEQVEELIQGADWAIKSIQ